MKSKRLYSSMRANFAGIIHQKMMRNKKIWIVVNDLGYKMWDKIRADFPERFINAGSAEQTMLGVAVGLALSGKIPIVYSITSFLLYRPFETIRNYIDYEKIPVKLVGGGHGRDYLHEGFSHWVEEDKKVMAVFKNIKSVWLEQIEEIPTIVDKMIKSKEPWYLNLRR